MLSSVYTCSHVHAYLGIDICRTVNIVFIIRVCMYVFMHACMYVWSVCMYICMYDLYVCMYVWSVCMYVCMYIYIFIYIHIYYMSIPRASQPSTRECFIHACVHTYTRWSIHIYTDCNLQQLGYEIRDFESRLKPSVMSQVRASRSQSRLRYVRHALSHVSGTCVTLSVTSQVLASRSQTRLIYIR